MEAQKVGNARRPIWTAYLCTAHCKNHRMLLAETSMDEFDLSAPQQKGKAEVQEAFARFSARQTVVGSTLKMVAMLPGVSFSAAICSCA